MKKYIASEFCTSMRSLMRSWCYVREDFAVKFEELYETGFFDENGPAEHIWETKSKFVLKVPVAENKFAVYKSYRRISKPAKFILRPSPCGFEAENYQLIKKCGIPVPELSAVGDVRRNFRLKTAFLVTEFAENFRDGRDFLSGGIRNGDKELKDEFICGHLELLARCHDAGILHRGFTPANLLYKLRSAPDEKGRQLELMWIDVASCRRRPMFLLNSMCLQDLEQLFSYFDFSQEEKQKFTAFYRSCRQR
ncbi:MAG: hypothetical protein IKA87_05295 [Lentisphaeria bacterium]|nr:hypothetical protein [Lentisphaeria bacterium]